MCWYVQYAYDWYHSDACTPHGSMRQSCCEVDWYGATSHKYIDIKIYDPAAGSDWR